MGDADLDFAEVASPVGPEAAAPTASDRCSRGRATGPVSRTKLSADGWRPASPSRVRPDENRRKSGEVQRQKP